MKLQRLAHQPGELLEFYEEGLSAMGALCERTWHDRLQVIAEGRVARLWDSASGELHEVELHFAAPDVTVARDAAREVFPGCPLTFRLAEALRLAPTPLERFVLPDPGSSQPPDHALLEKLWRAQFPESRGWRLTAALKPDYNFTLLAIVRCEIQAIDQHWSAHRIAVSLADGEPDEHLAGEIAFYYTGGAVQRGFSWPSPDPTRWRDLMQEVLARELGPELETVRERQENSLRRELERVDDYFQTYEAELLRRSQRGSSAATRAKVSDRLAAAKAEHDRRRADQLARHEIHVYSHFDMLLLVAEKAWRAEVHVEQARQPQEISALFVPRARRWSVISTADA
jgi:hypothetical protein